MISLVVIFWLEIKSKLPNLKSPIDFVVKFTCFCGLKSSKISKIQTLKVKRVRVINEIFIWGYLMSVGYMSVGVISWRNTISKLRLTLGGIKNSVFPKIWHLENSSQEISDPLIGCEFSKMFKIGNLKFVKF